MFFRYIFLILLYSVPFSLYFSFLSIHLKGKEEQRVSFYSKIDTKIEHVLTTSNKQYMDTIKAHSKILSTANEASVLDWNIIHHHLNQGERYPLSYHALYVAYILSIDTPSASRLSEPTGEKNALALHGFLKNELLIQ